MVLFFQKKIFYTHNNTEKKLVTKIKTPLAVIFGPAAERTDQLERCADCLKTHAYTCDISYQFINQYSFG